MKNGRAGTVVDLNTKLHYSPPVAASQISVWGWTGSTMHWCVHTHARCSANQGKKKQGWREKAAGNGVGA